MNIYEQVCKILQFHSISLYSSYNFLLATSRHLQEINWNLQGILNISEHLYFDTWQTNTDVQETNVVYLRIFLHVSLERQILC